MAGDPRSYQGSGKVRSASEVLGLNMEPREAGAVWGYRASFKEC